MTSSVDKKMSETEAALLPQPPCDTAHSISEPPYADIFQHIDEMVCVCDPDLVFRYCNTRLAKAFGKTPSEVIGTNVFALNPVFQRSVFYEVMSEVQGTRKATSRLGFSKSTGRWILMRVYPYRDGTVVFAADATDLDSRQHQLSQVKRRDPLTGLFNRLAFIDDVSAWIARGGPFTLALIDLKRLKTVNDSVGHAQGDRVLQEVAARLKYATPDGGLCFRLNGDEFAILHPGTPSDAENWLNGVLAQGREPFRVDEHLFALGLSVGWSAYPEDGGDYSVLMRRADLALLSAKNRKHESVAHRYDEAMEREALEKISLETALRRALERDELELHYQPKADLGFLQPIGAEVLLRWNHPQMGPIPPSVFLALADERGLMPMIDRQVVRRAIEDMAKLMSHGIQLPIAVNMTAVTLGDPELPDFIFQLLKQYRVPARLLELELTEGTLMADAPKTINVLKELSKIGLSLTIDDFGTGYSSFSYLVRFPITTLKIDRTFISQMLDKESSNSLAVVKSIVALAHSLKMAVVAEGVEDRKQVTMLKKMHCDVLQGYYYSRPLPLTRFIEFIYEQSRTSVLVPDPYK